MKYLKTYKIFESNKFKDRNIYQAAINGDMSSLEHCITPENINNKNEHSLTPLMYASYYHKKEALKFLIERGSDILIIDNNDMTAYDHDWGRN